MQDLMAALNTYLGQTPLLLGQAYPTSDPSIGGGGGVDLSQLNSLHGIGGGGAAGGAAAGGGIIDSLSQALGITKPIGQGGTGFVQLGLGPQQLPQPGAGSWVNPVATAPRSLGPTMPLGGYQQPQQSQPVTPGVKSNIVQGVTQQGAMTAANKFSQATPTNKLGAYY